MESNTEGFTGKLFITTTGSDARHRVKKTFNAPESGSTIIEFRYTERRESEYPSPVEINSKMVSEIKSWQTGNTGAWVWNRVSVDFIKGENTIQISPEGLTLLDYLDIINN